MNKWPGGKWRVFNKNGVVGILTYRNRQVIHWTGFDACDFPNKVVAIANLCAAAPRMAAYIAKQDDDEARKILREIEG